MEAIDSLGTAVRELQEGLPVREHAEPTIEDVATHASTVIRKIMSRGSNKSRFGELFHKNSLRYNSERAIAHMTRAMQQIDGNTSSPDSSGETCIDHLERALVRAVFTLYKAKEGKIH
jgi:hypothetical protein